MLHEVVVTPVLVHIPPQDHTSFSGPEIIKTIIYISSLTMLHSLDIGPNDWEDSVSPGGDVREVAHHRGHPVPGEHVEHLPGLQGVLASSHQNLNNVMELAAEDRCPSTWS